jgi:hypothetical protein
MQLSRPPNIHIFTITIYSNDAHNFFCRGLQVCYSDSHSDTTPDPSYNSDPNASFDFPTDTTPLLMPVPTPSPTLLATPDPTYNIHIFTIFASHAIFCHIRLSLLRKVNNLNHSWASGWPCSVAHLVPSPERWGVVHTATNSTKLQDDLQHRPPFNAEPRVIPA